MKTVHIDKLEKSNFDESLKVACGAEAFVEVFAEGQVFCAVYSIKENANEERVVDNGLLCLVNLEDEAGGIMGRFAMGQAQSEEKRSQSDIMAAKELEDGKLIVFA